MRDLLDGKYRIVRDLEIQMDDPLLPTEKVKAKFTGQVLNGRPHGLGEFTLNTGKQKSAKGIGMFEFGAL